MSKFCHFFSSIGFGGFHCGFKKCRVESYLSDIYIKYEINEKLWFYGEIMPLRYSNCIRFRGALQLFSFATFGTPQRVKNTMLL